MVFIASYVSGVRKLLSYYDEFISDVDLAHFVASVEACSPHDICLQCNGRVLNGISKLHRDDTVVAFLRLVGGKGGFGSMLRAIGAQIEKTTNREACRDLSGRRLRDINEEKRLKEYLTKKADKEREKLENRREKLEKLKDPPRHIFEDKKYFEQREKIEKDMFESLDKAFEKDGKSGAKRQQDPSEPEEKSKKRRLPCDFEESDSSEEEEEGANEVPCDAVQSAGSST